MSKMDHVQKGRVQQKNSCTCLKGFKSLHPTACQYWRLLPTWEKVHYNKSSPFSMPYQRIHFLLCFIILSLLLLAPMHLGKKTLVWVHWLKRVGIASMLSDHKVLLLLFWFQFVFPLIFCNTDFWSYPCYTEIKTT